MKIIFSKNYTPDNKKSVAIFFTKETMPKVQELEMLKELNLADIMEASDVSLSKSFVLELSFLKGFKKIVLIYLDDKSLTPKKIKEEAGKSLSYITTEEIFLFNFINEEALTYLTIGFRLKSWKFNKYITKINPKEKSLKVITIIGDTQPLEYGNAIVEGVNFARYLISEPANVLYPLSYAEIIKNELAPLGVEVLILNRKDLEKQKMGALLSVSQGSTTDPCVVVMKYSNATDKSKAPVALIGKGVTYDTGGYSLKPPLSMLGMKKDMGGSAAVVGTLKTLALRKAKVNVVGVVGLVENMVSGSATKPGDIITSMSGKTIEVLNTDAEGRLVLADILWYAKETYNPEVMIDLATLTGAIIVSLGSERAGMFSNDDNVAKQIVKSAESTGELLWQMPLGEEYAKHLKSSVADLQNISLIQTPGSIFAAMFLKEFVQNTKWVHIDIAGTADTPADTPLFKKGARGYGVMLLNNFIKNNYES